jgi:hypothetical protein
VPVLHYYLPSGADSVALLASSLLFPAAMLLACSTHPSLVLCTLIYSVGVAGFSQRRIRCDAAAAA